MSGAADPGILACAEGAERAHIHHDLSRRGARAAGTRACRRCNPPHVELVRALFEVARKTCGLPTATMEPPMNLEINGRRALVTAASRGLGRAIACALAAEGAEVVAVARNTELLRALVGQSAGLRGSIATRNCDLPDAGAISALSAVPNH